MPNTFYHFLLTLIIFLCVCLCTLAFISPYSFTSFVGPAAGITSALVIFYGARIIPVIIIATLLYCSFLFFWLNLPVESSLVIITLLAFVLQGFWAKQLTYKEVNKQKWLKSRRVLLTFLLKVGPLNSLISAFSVIILTLLENKEFGDNLFFTFFSCWSGSLLFSIFFTPLFLLYQGRHQLSLSKRFFIMVASLLAVVAIALLFYISQNVQQHQRQVFFNKVKSRVVQKIQHEVALTSDKLNSLSAFIKVNREVTSNDFSLFAAQILQKISNVRVLEWAPAVNHRNRSVFEKNIKSIVEKNVEGSFQKAGDRNRYAPIKYQSLKHT